MARGYDSDPFWKQVQDYLPESNRLNAGNLPQEIFKHIRIGSRSFRIHCDVYRKEEADVRLFLLHGVGGNGRLLSFLALPFSRMGYEVVCPDLPMYGYSEYEGTVHYSDWVDICELLAEDFQRADDKKTVLFGLSAGGLLAYQTACRRICADGLIVTCILDQRRTEITRSTALNPVMGTLAKPVLAAFHRWMGRMTLPMKLVGNMKAITNEPALAEILMMDKRSSGARVSMEFLYGMLNPVVETEPENFTKCPFLLVHPGADRWTDIRFSKDFYDRLPGGKQMYILENAGHFPIEQPGLAQLESICDGFLSGVASGEPSGVSENRE